MYENTCEYLINHLLLNQYGIYHLFSIFTQIPGLYVELHSNVTLC